MKIDFVPYKKDGIAESLCSVEWSAVPRRGDGVGIAGKLWYVRSVVWTSYVKSDGSPIDNEDPLVTVFLSTKKEKKL